MYSKIPKYNKYAVNLPYPEPKVEMQSTEYANILLKDYAGRVSEFSAISLYVYQQFISEEEYSDYAKLVGGISITEMKHLQLLGATIKLEGIKPIYIDNAYPQGKIWTPMYINYTTNIKAMLKEDIKSEQIAIENYRYHITLIKDKYIIELLERIILDEELHIKLFTEAYEKYSNLY
ncbi:ferritin-like domain-containing protein [Clostridium sp.]|uniref:ferritin-like domain-containing protein n=1 Tax=Clostridium sp. TaxID=1506 RepID=UPI00262D296C|nr:ferritin-like domain-containing protein [Clostridium sp.]